MSEVSPRHTPLLRKTYPSMVLPSQGQGRRVVSGRIQMPALKTPKSFPEVDSTCT